MAYSKDYYSILHLPPPTFSSSTPSPLSTADLRRAYKVALLSAHPDKQTPSTTAAPTAAQQHTIDHVKEAYAVLSDPRTKKDYDDQILRNPTIVSGNPWAAHGSSAGDEGVLSSDFVLGLEVLDLSDFDVLDPGFEFSEDPSEAAMASSSAARAEAAEDGKQMEWTRACRCGAEQGFRILEEELEDAERRGEKEVLVGCGGCSLWVRVGFDVEE